MAKREVVQEPVVVQETVVEAPQEELAMNTVDGQEAAAKEVLDGESARDLLEQVVGYIGPGTKGSFVGDPERWKSVRDKVEAFLLLNPK